MSQAKPDPRNYIDTKLFPRLETLTVSVPATFMRRQARPSAPAETQLVFGQTFHVHKIGRGWVWGQIENLLPGASYPGYTGWVRRSDLSDVEGAPSHKITAMSAPVFSNADIKSPLQRTLPMNSLITASKAASFFKTADGYIHQNHVSDLSQSSRHADWVSIAESLIGQPYIWAGVSSFGLDCSGLVQTAMQAFGMDAPRDSDQQAKMGQAVPTTDDLSGLQRGDLVFWQGHVGIMTSATRLLHANAHHMMVAVEPLVTAAARIRESAGAVTEIRRLG